MKRTLTLTSPCLVFLMSIMAISQEPAPLLDLAQLNLEVTNTEIVDRIVGINQMSLKPEEGHKLIAVTLKGTVPRASHLVIWFSDFVAVYG